MGVMRVNEINPRKRRTGLGLRASLVLAVAAGIALFAGMTSPAHALNPIMHNSSTLGSTKWPGGWGNSVGSKYGQFTCSTCHTAGTTAGNAKQIKGTISIPGGPSPSGTVVFNSWSAYGSPSSHTASTRVCEVCHSVTNYHKYGSSASHYDDSSQADKDCTSCHAHNTGFKASGSCNSCHGYPPGNTSGLVSSPRVTNAMASGVYGAHSTHYKTRKFECKACHNAYTTSPMGNNKIELGFVIFKRYTVSGAFTPYSSTNGYHFAGTNPYVTINTVVTGAYTNANKCSNIYCHGGGNSSKSKPALDGGTNKQPDWELGSSQAVCGTCHGTDASTAFTLGSHAKHAGSATGYSISCSKCHATVTNGTHVRGKAFMRLSTGHAMIGATATYNGTFTNYSGSELAPSSSYKTCASVICHSNGRTGVYQVFTNRTWGLANLPADCTGCHGNDKNSSSPLQSYAHKAHMNNASARYNGMALKCNECHNTVVDGTNRTIISKPNHVNGTGTVSIARGGSYGSYACSSVYCHSSGEASPAYVNPANWNTVAETGEGNAGCNFCHGGLKADNPNHIATKKHARHIGVGVNIPHADLPCYQCHRRTARVSNVIMTNSTGLHLNSARNVSMSNNFNGILANYTGLYSPGTDDCLNTYCHGNQLTPAWSSVQSRACSDCHGTIVNAGMSRPHHKHYSSTTKPTSATGWTNNNNSTTSVHVFLCGTCHNVNSATQHVNGPQEAGKGPAEVAFNIQGRGASGSNNAVKSSTGVQADGRKFDYSPNTTCSVYCHSNGKVNWKPRTQSWTSGTVVCGSCHSIGSAFYDWTSSHNKHVKDYKAAGNPFIKCNTCHATTLNITDQMNLRNRHVNGFANVTTTTAGFVYNATTKTCSTNYCHSTGRNSQYNNPTWRFVSYSSMAGGCTSCHGGRNATTGALARSIKGYTLSTTHYQHLRYPAANVNCQMCHGRTAASHTALKQYTGAIAHVNNSKDVTFRDITYGSYTSFKADKSCKNVSCHGGKTRGTWSTSSINTNNTCVHCHGTNGTTTAIVNSGDNRKFFAPGWPKNSAGAANRGIDTDGDISSANYQVGAHFVHLSSVYMKKIKCNECHTVPSNPFDGQHMAQPRFTISQTLNFSQSSSARWDAGNNTTLSAFSGYTSGTAIKPATCSSVYCHGYRLKYGDNAGSYRKPYWNYSAMIKYTDKPATGGTACGTCHGIPPSSQSGNHAGKTISNCVDCHPAVVNSSGTIINKALHINRTVQFVAGDCTSCHSGVPTGTGTQYVTRNVVGTDFAYASRHVYGGTVIKWDCIICHREGDQATGATSSLHDTTSTGKTVKLRNVDNITTGWTWNKTAITPAMQTDLDNFCLACHDADGAIGINVNASNTGLNLNNTRALKPFNTSDGLGTGTQAGSFEQPGYYKTRVLDVRTQFATTNPSHHAVLGKAYTGTPSANWPSTAWVSRVLKNNNQLQTTRETSQLHCADCHTVDQNGHGGANQGMLQASTVDGTCWNCHSNAVYNYPAANETQSRFNHATNDGTNTIVAKPTTIGNSGCRNCHGGDPEVDGYGGIHGMSGTDARNSQTRYRFIGGVYMAPYVGSWTGTTGTPTCYFQTNSKTQPFATCTQHNSNQTGRITNGNYNRGLPGTY
ncbi:MAG: CxxxxCH/CxxCH domain-containing protein [Geobacter sp.]|nr:CxxxxCH/CxxCH domain-containing protein [Geobacter sp.]